MKRFLIIFLYLCCMMRMYAQQEKISAGTANFSVKTDVGDFLFEKNGEQVEIIPLQRGFIIDCDTLSPVLPCIGVNVLIPPTADYEGVLFDDDEVIVMSGVSIVPNSAPVPTCELVQQQHLWRVDYEKEVYPKTNVAYTGTHLMDGYKFISFTVCPFRYDAVDEVLYLKRNINVRVFLKNSFKQTKSIGKVFGKNMHKAVRDLVVNGQDMDSLYPFSKGHIRNTNTTNSYPSRYIIVTTDSLRPVFEKLARWKTIKGVRTKVVTVDECITEYSSDTPQMAIKKVLTDYYLDGMEYVLLGGDVDMVPAQICSLPFTTVDSSDTPADLYYACLDNDPSWDANGNEIYGERADSIDLAPEFIVTRVSVSTNAESETYVNRVIEYETHPKLENWDNKMLSFGYKVFGYTMKNGVQISDSQYNGELVYEDEVQPNWNGSLYELFDTYTSHPSGANYAANTAHIQEEMEKGYTFADEYSHGWIHIWGPLEGSAYKNGDAEDLVNSGYTTITTIACYTNAFDKTSAEIPDASEEYATCLSEAFIRNPDSGILAYYGSSREGWSSISPLFTKEFYHNMFGGLDQQFGRSAMMSKTAFQGNLQNNYYRWLTLTINPIGDAEMPLYLDTPRQFDNVSVTFSNDTLVVITGVNDCRICVCSVSDNGVSYYACVDSVSFISFTNVDSDCYLCVSKTGYVPYIARVGTTVYLQNESIFRDLPIFSTKTYVGHNVTSARSQGPVIIERGRTTNISRGSFCIKNSFTVETGAELMVKPVP